MLHYSLLLICPILLSPTFGLDKLRAWTIQGQTQSTVPLSVWKIFLSAPSRICWKPCSIGSILFKILSTSIAMHDINKCNKTKIAPNVLYSTFWEHFKDYIGGYLYLSPLSLQWISTFWIQLSYQYHVFATWVPKPLFGDFCIHFFPKYRVGKSWILDIHFLAFSYKHHSANIFFFLFLHQDIFFI